MAMLAHAGLAKRWWAEAVNTAAFIQNRVIHGPTATPIHALTGHRAKLDKLRVFGCVAYNMVKDPTRRDKLAPKATKCVFMGYAEHQKAWKLYDLESNKMVTGVHVTFSEEEFLGDRTKLDDYLVTTDDDDDDEVRTVRDERMAKPSTSSWRCGSHQQNQATSSLPNRSPYLIDLRRKRMKPSPAMIARSHQVA